MEDITMETLKKIFPLSFKYTGSVANLIIGILIYIVVGIVGGLVIGLTALIPIINIVCGLLGAIIDVYVIAGIVIQFLVHFKVLK